MKQTTIRHTTAAIASMLVGAGLLVGCSSPGEDVRVRLCKDLVAVQLGADQLQWSQVSTKTPGYQDAIVSLRWSRPEGNGSTGSTGSATCAYPYTAVDDTAQQLAEPLSAYATSPSKVVINGETLSGTALANVIGQAMQRQGREMIDAASNDLRQ